MLTEKTFMRIFKTGAIYDLLAALPFTTPWTYHLLSGLLGELHHALGVPGLWPEPQLLDTFFANLMGSLVIIWTFARLYLEHPVLARFDAAGRYLFSFWMIYALISGVSQLMWIYLMIELIFGILQSLPYRKNTA